MSLAQSVLGCLLLAILFASLTVSEIAARCGWVVLACRCETLALEAILAILGWVVGAIVEAVWTDWRQAAEVQE